ncbi:chromosomal replication initiator DnaA [Rhodopila sp.]|uniref:chromosomal replication initiator DnaA n=1 Tax=Rhodopila sp. TaxID=2480087 RepID=UPI003D0C0338
MPAASNQEALAWLDIDWPDQRLALWGPDGCGKSHLLHVWAERRGARILSGPTLRDLDGVPESGGLALDDADAVTAEPLLLHLLNTARDRGLRLLLSGHRPPSRWHVHLPDLSSRLRAITTTEIRQPSDDLLAMLLARLLADRQMSVAQRVQDWLLTQIDRSPDALRYAVACLDDISMTAGKPITLFLAAKVIRSEEFLVTAGGKSGLSRSDRSS